MIRCMAKRDYQAAYDLWSEIAGMGLRSLDDTFGGIARFLARNPTTCFVAEDQGQILGTILCGHDGRRAYIYHLAVKESQRGKGYGRALVEATEAALEKEGITKVALVVFDGNDLGNRFWEGLGYTLREDLNYRNKRLNKENQ